MGRLPWAGNIFLYLVIKHSCGIAVDNQPGQSSRIVFVLPSLNNRMLFTCMIVIKILDMTRTWLLLSNFLKRIPQRCWRLETRWWLTFARTPTTGCGVQSTLDRPMTLECRIILTLPRCLRTLTTTTLSSHQNLATMRCSRAWRACPSATEKPLRVAEKTVLGIKGPLKNSRTWWSWSTDACWEIEIVYPYLFGEAAPL